MALSQAFKRPPFEVQNAPFELLRFFKLKFLLDPAPPVQFSEGLVGIKAMEPMELGNLSSMWQLFAKYSKEELRGLDKNTTAVTA